MRKRLATISYILLILFINIGFSWMPMYRVFGSSFSPMDPIAGVVYLVRDFAQRELGHYIFLAMAVGSILSYIFASPSVALASVSAFIVGELIDWAIFTFTRKPLNQRLIWSSCVSAPVDSLIFISMLHYLSWASFLLMTCGKIVGVVVIWFVWKIKDKKSTPPKRAEYSIT